MMRKCLLSVLLVVCPLLAQAQEVFINADLVSNYIWRGMKCGNASVQPTPGVSMGHFTLSAWSSTEFRNENNIALTAAKEIQITDRFSLPLFGKLGFNPYESTAYFIVGISL